MPETVEGVAENVALPVTEVVGGQPWMPELSDEWANQLTHAAAFVLCAAGSVFLLTSVLQQGSALQVTGVLIYAVTNLALFAASTLSHSFADQPRRDFWRTMDQVCIFVMMAGTFTPVAFASCRDGWSTGLIVGMWAVALIGIAWKLIVAGLETVPVWFYVVLGFIPMLVADRLVATLGSGGMFWVVAGGVSYLIGLLFFLNDHRGRFIHAGWHLMVIAGSICHYIVVFDCSIRVH